MPPNVTVNVDAMLPALQEMNQRLDGIARLLAGQADVLQVGQSLQQQVVQLQQQVVNLHQQAAQPAARGPKGAQGAQGTPQPVVASLRTEEIAPFFNEVLKGIQILVNAGQQQAEMAQRQAQLQAQQFQLVQQALHNQGQQAVARGEGGEFISAPPVEVHFEEIRPVLEDIKDCLGTLVSATNAAAQAGAEVDGRSKRGSEETYPIPSRTETYSTWEEEAPPQPPRPGPARARAPMSPPAPVASAEEALFAEEEAYLNERKEYLDERKDFLARKRQSTRGRPEA